MKLHQNINSATKTVEPMNEDAAGGAVGAGAIAVCAMPMFSSFVKRNIPTPTIIKYGKSVKNQRTKKKTLSLAEAMRSVFEGDEVDPNFDATEVISKLKAIENKEKQDHRDTTTFGIEDDNGNIIRVIVRNEQATDFERALRQFITDADDDQQIPDVAEVMFELKDQFDIVDVVWPEVEEDEEEVQGVEGGENVEGGEGIVDGEEGNVGADMDMDMGAPAGDTDQAATLLTQVIDMMKADADARKAEAKAREAEAHNREAEAMTQQAMARVKQEEQILDMETYNKSKKEQDREAKRLAQLAKWKHDMDADETDMDDVVSSSFGVEDEEVTNKQPRQSKSLRGRVKPHDIAEYILKRVK